MLLATKWIGNLSVNERSFLQHLKSVASGRSAPRPSTQWLLALTLWCSLQVLVSCAPAGMAGANKGFSAQSYAAANNGGGDVFSPQAPAVLPASNPTVLESTPAKPLDPPPDSTNPAAPVSGGAPVPAATPSQVKVQTQTSPCMGALNEAALVQVCLLVNQERAKYKLAPLKMDAKISQMSQVFAQDMADKNYFSHISPSGVTMEMRFAAAGIPWSWAGENIAEGQPTPSEVVTAWINSPEHRANLMQPNYHKLGLGKVALIWVQDFSD